MSEILLDVFRCRNLGGCVHLTNSSPVPLRVTYLRKRQPTTSTNGIPRILTLDIVESKLFNYSIKWKVQANQTREINPVLILIRHALSKLLCHRDSCFGLGTCYEIVEIQPTRHIDHQHIPNPVLVFAFILSVLG